MNKTVKLTLSDEMLQILNSCKGQRLAKMRYIYFVHANRAFGNIGLYFEQKNVEIANVFEAAELDAKEDYARFEISSMRTDDLTPSLLNSDFTDRYIDDVLRDVKVATDTIKWRNEGKTYTLVMDSALILTLDQKNIVLQKDIWFSEEILIFTGLEYEKNMVPIEDGWDFDPEAGAKFERTIRSI